MIATRSLSTRRHATAVGAALAVWLLAACGGDSIDADDLSEEVSTELGELRGVEPPDVSCPDELESEVGATTTCLLTAEDGSTIDVNVEVTEVDGNDVSFDIQVADAPN